LDIIERFDVIFML